MIKLMDLINEEIKEYFKTHKYSLEDELIMENEILLGELLNPIHSYPYEGDKGFYTYEDINGVNFFVRITYHPIQFDRKNKGYFEFKTGWLDNNGKAVYEPSIPPISKKSSAIDWDKRSNTVAKIYRDEILPFFEQQNLSTVIVIKPISPSRMKFAERLVNKFTDFNKFNINNTGGTIIINKK